MNEDPISVSTLRAELIALELRIVDRLSGSLAAKADAVHVEQLDARISTMEIWRAGREKTPETLIDHEARISRLERFRYAIPSAAVLSVLVAAATFFFGFSK